MGDLFLWGLVFENFANFDQILENKTSWKFYEMVIRENKYIL